MENTHRDRAFSRWVKKTSKFLSSGRVKNQVFCPGFLHTSKACFDKPQAIWPKPLISDPTRNQPGLSFSFSLKFLHCKNKIPRLS